MLCIFVLIATCLTACQAGYSQFFYSAFPAPIQQVQQYQPNYYQPAPVAYHQQAYQHFVPQFPTPTTQYTSFGYPGYHQGYQPSFPSFPQPQYTYTPTVQDDATHATTQTPSSTTTTVAPATESGNHQEIDEADVAPERDDTVVTNAEFRTTQTPQTTNDANSFDNFRGFGYRNQFEGGQSHFVFITGPEAHQFRQSQSQTQAPLTSTRTSASDAVDSVATSAAATTPEDNHSIDALIKYLENPQFGVQRFYSVNNALVTRRLEDEIPQLPVAPVQQLPFAQPLSPLFPLLRSSFQLNVETTTAKQQADESKDYKEEHEGSASQIETKSVAPETAASTTVMAESTTAAALASTTVTTSTATSSEASTSKSESSSTVAATTSETIDKSSTMEPIVVE